MFEVRSGTNVELGRHTERKGQKECLLCGDKCESVLSECTVYSSLRNDTMCKVHELPGDGFESFKSLESFEKVSFVLGTELCEGDCNFILDLV